MNESFSGTAWRLTCFTAVCVVAMFATLTIFAQFRFDSTRTYAAQFHDVSGLKGGNFVRIAGVEVGKVEEISIGDNGIVTVVFDADDSVALNGGTRAIVRYDNVIGGRYLALEDGPGAPGRLPAGATIPPERTAPALDLDALIGGFRPLFRALDPKQVNALSAELISAFQGRGATISTVLSQTAVLTNTLADRDELVGQVIANLNTVLGSLSQQKDQFVTAVDSLSELINGLASHKQDITNSIAYANAASGSIADLLQQSRPAIQKVVTETDRTAAIVVADHDYFDDLLNTLPETYRVLGRQGLTGNYFSFYMCDVVLKVNGKGGQPVYVKVAGQDTGRCTPR
jgi:phospholipid/cholesterol/gamma-HCH transport system substrate-binding protein